MAGSSKSRRRRTPEEDRINLDDWGNAGALEGLLSFLNIRPEEAAVHQISKNLLAGETAEAEKSITGTLPDIDRVPVIQAESTHSLQITPEPTAAIPSVIDPLPESAIQADVSASTLAEDQPAPVEAALLHEDSQTPVDTDTQEELDPPLRHPKQATGFGNKRIHRCQIAQDGHSHGEEALYQLLWRSGKPEGEDSRIVAMGYGEISKRVRLSFNNAKATCRRLIQKLSIEEVAREISDIRQGKTYRVFSYKLILERRRAVGMEWVIRSKGVEFVTPVFDPEMTIDWEAEPTLNPTLKLTPSATLEEDEKEVPLGMVNDLDLPITGTLPVIDQNCITGRVGTPSITGRGTPSISGRGTPSISGTLLGNSFREVDSQSSAEHLQVAAALAKYGLTDDDEAVLRLIERSRVAAPDCTAEEICHFLHRKGALAQKLRVTNPIGFLLTSVPKCLVGESFQRYRLAERRRNLEAEARRRQEENELFEWRREQEAQLRDPKLPEEEKRWIRKALGMEAE